VADEITVRVVVGSRRDLGDEDGRAILDMIAYPELPENVALMGSPAQCRITLFSLAQHVQDVQLDTQYDVTFTPVE
jgi:hypothetical protein